MNHARDCFQPLRSANWSWSDEHANLFLCLISPKDQLMIERLSEEMSTALVQVLAKLHQNSMPVSQKTCKYSGLTCTTSCVEPIRKHSLITLVTVDGSLFKSESTELRLYSRLTSQLPQLCDSHLFNAVVTNSNYTTDFFFSLFKYQGLQPGSSLFGQKSFISPGRQGPKLVSEPARPGALINDKESLKMADFGVKSSVFE